MSLDVSVEYATVCECPSSQEIQHWISAVLSSRKPNAILALRIVDADEMRAVNHQYRQKDKPTNVLSFPCQLPSNLKGNQLGDILICAPVVAEEARAQQKSLSLHWAHMVVHGVLHLLGYDHVDPSEADQMEALEIGILQQLGFSNPYGVTLTHD